MGKDETRKSTERFLPHAHLDATVLGHPSLGDIQTGKNLHPGDQGIFDGQRQVHGFKQGTILTISDLHAFFIRFDMDIRHPVLHRLNQDTIDQFDNRRIRGGELLAGFIDIIHFQFEIIGGFGNDRTEVIDLGDIELLVDFVFAPRKRVRLLLIDSVIFPVGLDDISFG